MLSLRSRALASPSQPALVIGDQVLSYEELAGAVLPRARWMQAQQIVRLAVVAERSREAVFSMLAAIEVGIPLVLLHPRWSPAERGAALAQLGEHTLVDEGSRFEAGAGDEQVTLPAPESIDPETCLAVVFTSGSTGRPRGVVLSRRALVAAAESSAAHLGWRDDDRWLVSLPLAHLGGFSILIRTLLAGRCAVLAPVVSTPPLELLALIEASGVTLMSLVPSMLGDLISASPTSAPPARLRAVLVGGAACSPALEQRARAGGWPTLLTYGMTETCGQVATQQIGTEPGQPGAVGVPLSGVELCIEEGEILVSGPALLSGILGEGESPLDARGRFHTGDLGELSEGGLLRVLGRADQRINSGGEKVHPSEVEDAILGFEGVAEACVVGLSHERWGEAVVGVVRWEDAASDRSDALAQFLEARLAPWKRPKWIESMRTLPRTPSGKVDRSALTTLLASSRGTVQGVD